jgi:hypothetical protein
MPVTREQYREHMNRYAHETASLSFTAYKHPDYQALLAMGKDIVPYLLEDIKAQNPDGSWNGDDEYWFSFWSGLELLRRIAGDDRPAIPEEIRGKLKPLRQLHLEWGVQHGFLTSETKMKPWYAWRPWQK